VTDENSKKIDHVYRGGELPVSEARTAAKRVLIGERTRKKLDMRHSVIYMYNSIWAVHAASRSQLKNASAIPQGKKK
jgi:hypothetical protein